MTAEGMTALAKLYLECSRHASWADIHYCDMHTVESELVGLSVAAFSTFAQHCTVAMAVSCALKLPGCTGGTYRQAYAEVLGARP